MINYPSIAQKAVDMLAKYGRQVTLSRMDRTPDDPTRPWRGSTGETTITAMAVFVSPISGTELGVMETRGPESELLSGYEIGFIASQENPTEDLRTYDRMIDRGQVFMLEKMHELAPGPLSLVYTFEVRR